MSPERGNDPLGSGRDRGGQGDVAPRHPLAGKDEMSGRVVTVLDPDGYVMVDGLVVRAVLARGRAQVGDEVELRLGPGVLTAWGTGLAAGPGEGAAGPGEGQAVSAAAAGPAQPHSRRPWWHRRANRRREGAAPARRRGDGGEGTVPR